MRTWDRVEWIARAPGEPAEGPLWDADRQALWWVDIMQGHLHRWDRGSGIDEVHDIGEPVGALALRRDGSLLLALQSRLAFFDPASAHVETFVPLEADVPANRANDGKAGPDGAFWIGTMAIDLTRDAGAFYRVAPDGATTRVLDGVSISNGIDWIDDERLYYIDSFAGGIDVLDRPLDGVTRERLVAIPESEGLPDGMTLDAEGCIWVALHGAGEVRRLSPAGETVGRVVVPAPEVTCCAFGGADLTELYITVAGGDHGLGGLLRCDVGVSGRLPFRFAG